VPSLRQLVEQELGLLQIASGRSCSSTQQNHDYAEFTGNSAVLLATACLSQLKSGLTSAPRLPQASVAYNKVADVFGYWYAIDIAAGLNFFGHLVGNILDPVLKCVEGHDANRSVELAG